MLKDPQCQQGARELRPARQKRGTVPRRSQETLGDSYVERGLRYLIAIMQRHNAAKHSEHAHALERVDQPTKHDLNASLHHSQSLVEG